MGSRSRDLEAQEKLTLMTSPVPNLNLNGLPLVLQQT